MRRLLRWCWQDIRDGENTDLWLLAAVAFLFSILGATGVASADALSSMVLALLVVVAISQIRTRRQLDQALDRANESGSLLAFGFPEEHFERRERVTSSYLFIGSTMGRTLATARPVLERLLSGGGSVRIVLPNPGDQRLIRMIAEGHRHGDGPEQMRISIESTLSVLRSIKDGVGGDLQVRCTRLPPKIGFNGLDLEGADGSLMVQHYEFQPRAEPAPILHFLASRDRVWFGHFRDEAERIWSASEPVEGYGPD